MGKWRLKGCICRIEGDTRYAVKECPIHDSKETRAYYEKGREKPAVSKEGGEVIRYSTGQDLARR